MAAGWGWAAMALGLALWPDLGRPDTPASPPGAPDGCAWRGPAGSALECRQADGAWAPVGVSGFGPDTWSLAQAHDPTAMRTLGRFYLYGPPAQHDAGAAVTLLQAAADQGDVRAMLELAVMYRDGVGAPRDYAKSTQWYRAAAQAGDPEGMFGFGNANLDARGLPEDDAEAVKWFRASADKGYPAAMARIGVLYFAGKGVGQDYGQAAAWFQKAADAGSPDGMRYLAYVYKKGMGVPQSHETAQRWSAAVAAIIKWDALPSEDEKQDVFPVDAAVASVSGIAYYVCRVGDDRSPQDCHLVSETPASQGFGEAGMRLIPEMRLGAGLPVGQEFTLPVRFALPTGIISNRGHADECAAEGIALRGAETLSADSDWWARYWVALSRYDARQVGEADTPDRLSAQVAAAGERLARGGDRGFFGLTSRCNLR